MTSQCYENQGEITMTMYCSVLVSNLLLDEWNIVG